MYRQDRKAGEISPEDAEAYAALVDEARQNHLRLEQQKFEAETTAGRIAVTNTIGNAPLPLTERPIDQTAAQVMSDSWVTRNS